LGQRIFFVKATWRGGLYGSQSAANAILEKTSVHSATVIPRMPMSSAPRRAAAIVALAACLVLAACSPGADYPSLFPSVHDIPPPRVDTPLDSNQVQQATEDLITARDRLTAESQGAQAKSSTGSTGSAGSPAKAAASAKTGTKPPAKSAGASAGKASGSAATAAATATQQTLGTEAAPAGGTETK
jgi:hypothetical protein